MLRTIALLLLVGGMQTANAVMITLDPNQYEVGTNLSNIQDGLTIARLRWPTGSPFGAPLPPDRTDVLAAECAPYFSCLTPTTLGFGMTNNLYDFAACERGSGACAGAHVNALEFLFLDPADSVSMLFTYGSDQPIIYAYDIAGALIDTCSGYAGCGAWFTHSGNERGTVLSINRAERDIYRIVAGGMAGNSFAQSITYSVPEPGTLSLLALGLAGLLVRRRAPH